MALALPVGKLPVDWLSGLFDRHPLRDPRVRLGPRVGADCAIVEGKGGLYAITSDPITFATEALGHYLVQVNANDLATVGATPRWLTVTLLLPEKDATRELADELMDQVYTACGPLGIAVVGGHTEVTAGLDRVIASATLVGELPPERVVTPSGMRPGDRLLLTKGVPIETTAILAREFPERLRGAMDAEEIRQARDFLFEPGIGVTRDARTALTAGEVTAMHDPTEGGLLSALHELAHASGLSLWVDTTRVPIPELAARACAAAGVEPLAAIASGALLIAVRPESAGPVREALESAGIACAELGHAESGPPDVHRNVDTGWEPLPWPERDALAALYEARDLGQQ